MSDTSSEGYTSGETSSDDIPSLLDTDELVRAANDGLLEKVDSLIAEGHDATEIVGYAALNYAAANGHAAVVTSLLAAGAPFDGFQDYHVDDGTPLMKAAGCGHMEIVELLLGANLNGYDDYGLTALGHAAGNGQVKIAAYLLEAGAPVNGCESHALITPLKEAAICGHVEAVELLLAAGANDINVPDEYGITTVGLAAHNGHTEVVSVLIRAGAELVPEEARHSPLLKAVEGQHADVVCQLLAAGLDPSGGLFNYKKLDGVIVRRWKAFTPLAQAAQDENLDIVRILLDAGADVNAESEGGYTALIMALMYGYDSNDLEVVRTLLKAGADPFADLGIDIKKFGNQRIETKALDFANTAATRELMKREMNRRIAAALSVMPVKVPWHVRQEILRLAYSWRPSLNS